MIRMCDIVRGSLGVPARRLAVALFAASPRSFLAVGFPLQSLTRNATTCEANGRMASCDHLQEGMMNLARAQRL